jgi:hypothetical protein
MRNFNKYVASSVKVSLSTSNAITSEARDIPELCDELKKVGFPNTTNISSLIFHFITQDNTYE